MKRIWFLLGIFAVISVPCASGDTTAVRHQPAEAVTVDKQINTRAKAPTLICPRADKKYDPKLKDYRGNQISLVEPDADKPTLVIIASADSKDKVLEFLAAFAEPVWNYRWKSRAFWSLGNSPQFVSDYWFGEEGWWEAFGPAWKNYKREMGKMEDLRVLIFADARPIYKAKLAEGHRQGEQERQAAIELGKAQGREKGEEIGAQRGRTREDGRERILPFLRRLGENIGREKGREEGARQGAEMGAKVADVMIPPFIAFMAETELMKKADELLPSVKKILENRLVKDFDKQSGIAILVDDKDFAKGLTESGRRPVEWANSFLPKEKQLDPAAAIAMHKAFGEKTNSAADIMKGLVGKTDEGFHVVLVDPNGNPLKTWSDEKINAEQIAQHYLMYMEHLQGVKYIEGCPVIQ